MSCANGQITKKASPDSMKCKVVRMGHLIFLVSAENELFTTDTITAFDVGSAGTSCIHGRNSEFHDPRLNFYDTSEVREPYYDQVKKDSIVAWLDLKVFMFDAIVKYSNWKQVPPKYQTYHRVEHNNKMYVFKCFTHLDVHEIDLLRKDGTAIRFLNCYESIMSQ